MQGKSDVRDFLSGRATGKDTPRGELLKDRQITFSGRLASMSRREARDFVSSQGGEVVDAPTRRTDWVVVGEESPLLRGDGSLETKLERAQQLEAAGAEINVISEEEFLASTGRDDLQNQKRRYTIAQLSRILKIPSRQIRAWVRAGLIEPVQVVHRLPYFDYRQVAGAQTLSQLTRAGVSTAQIRRTLEKVEQWLPHADEALSQLRALEESGGELLVRLDDGTLVEPSGQLQLDFDSPHRSDRAEANTNIPSHPDPRHNPRAPHPAPRSHTAERATPGEQ